MTSNVSTLAGNFSEPGTKSVAAAVQDASATVTRLDEQLAAFLSRFTLGDNREAKRLARDACELRLRLDDLDKRLVTFLQR